RDVQPIIMTIANKITLLICVLVGVLCADTIVGLKQISRIHFEFTTVAHDGSGFTEKINTIERNHLAQVVLVQRLTGIAEETSFESVPFARRQYLMDQVKVIQDGFGHYAQLITADAADARNLLVRYMRFSG